MLVLCLVGFSILCEALVLNSYAFLLRLSPFSCVFIIFFLSLIFYSLVVLVLRWSFYLCINLVFPIFSVFLVLCFPVLCFVLSFLRIFHPLFSHLIFPPLLVVPLFPGTSLLSCVHYLFFAAVFCCLLCSACCCSLLFSSSVFHNCSMLRLSCISPHLCLSFRLCA